VPGICLTEPAEIVRQPSSFRELTCSGGRAIGHGADGERDRGGLVAGNPLVLLAGSGFEEAAAIVVRRGLAISEVAGSPCPFAAA